MASDDSKHERVASGLTGGPMCNCGAPPGTEKDWSHTKGCPWFRGPLYRRLHNLEDALAGVDTKINDHEAVDHRLNFGIEQARTMAAHAKRLDGIDQQLTRVVKFLTGHGVRFPRQEEAMPEGQKVPGLHEDRPVGDPALDRANEAAGKRIAENLKTLKAVAMSAGLEAVPAGEPGDQELAIIAKIRAYLSNLDAKASARVLTYLILRAVGHGEQATALANAVNLGKASMAPDLRVRGAEGAAPPSQPDADTPRVSDDPRAEGVQADRGAGRPDRGEGREAGPRRSP